MIAGSLAAHGIGYLGGVPAAEGVHAEGSELVGVHERAGGGYAGHSAMWLGILAALISVAGVRALAGRLGDRASRGLGVCCFCLLPVLAYCSQELIERLLAAESYPFNALLEPRFLFGLALQLPFATAAFLVGWLLLRVGAHLIRLLGAAWRPPALRARPLRLWAPAAVALPQIRPLSRGHPLRGPPLLA
jgi:hypothetical protein